MLTWLVVVMERRSRAELHSPGLAPVILQSCNNHHHSILLLRYIITANILHNIVNLSIITKFAASYRQKETKYKMHYRDTKYFQMSQYFYQIRLMTF